MQITKGDILEFLSVYSSSPFIHNQGGIESAQAFWLWYHLKKVDPLVVIESGVFHGGSTWLIEKTCPSAKIISIEPALNRIKYKSPNARYTTTDFNNIDWTSMLGGKDVCLRTLAFIDDHQDNYKRLQHAYSHSIKHMIFEDNYPTTHGDVLSLKKILSAPYHIMESNGRKSIQQIPVDYKPKVLSMCEYFECPPVYLDTEITRWGDKFKTHNCLDPIFKVVDDDLILFKNHQLNYTFIAYVSMHV